MKYKVGDKFVIEIEEINDGSDMPYIINDVYETRYDEEDLSFLKKIDINMTAEETWELARKIILHPDDGGYTADELIEMFGTSSSVSIIRNYTLQQLKTKIEAWKTAHIINVGDEVRFDDTENCIPRSMIVTSKFNDTDYCGICQNGDTYCVHKSALKKTGKHINISTLFEQIFN